MVDIDDATGLLGMGITAAVGLGVVKMTTDMVSNMSKPVECPKGKKWCSSCQSCMPTKHKHKGFDLIG